MGCGSSRPRTISNPILHIPVEGTFIPNSDRIIPLQAGRANPSRNQRSPDNRETILVELDPREYSEAPHPRKYTSSYRRRSASTVFEEE